LSSVGLYSSRRRRLSRTGSRALNSRIEQGHPISQRRIFANLDHLPRDDGKIWESLCSRVCPSEFPAPTQEIPNFEREKLKHSIHDKHEIAYLEQCIYLSKNVTHAQSTSAASTQKRPGFRSGCVQSGSLHSCTITIPVCQGTHRLQACLMVNSSLTLSCKLQACLTSVDIEGALGSSPAPRPPMFPSPCDPTQSTMVNILAEKCVKKSSAERGHGEKRRMSDFPKCDGRNSQQSVKGTS
jgi:hypothetical protein